MQISSRDIEDLSGSNPTLTKVVFQATTVKSMGATSGAGIDGIGDHNNSEMIQVYMMYMIVYESIGKDYTSD